MDNFFLSLSIIHYPFSIMQNLYDNNWLYDLVHEKPADGEQIAFYERQIERYGSPVLEIACGTGNYLVTLSLNDVEISGLDNSDEMLQGARRRAENQNTKTNLIKADMRNFELNQKFALIFVAGNSFQHLNRLEDVEACFDSVKKHLAPNGKFIVEVFNPSLELLNRNRDERYFVGEYKSGEGWIVLTENVFYDAATQINHLDWHYKNQFIKEEITVSFTMRQFFPQELDALFRYNNFRIEQKFGDFDESDFTIDSPKQIIVAGAI
ncbi:MAG: class I SAM-dependent methyltransferase [Acidobacteriota bacterium]|nr:class I SAM-dependent methyltransferase [Acidobacteriota bacterium]